MNGFAGRAVVAEWTKLRSVRSTAWTVAGVYAKAAERIAWPRPAGMLAGTQASMSVPWSAAARRWCAGLTISSVPR